MRKTEAHPTVRTRITLNRDLYRSIRLIAVEEGPQVDARQVIAHAVEEYVRRRTA